MMLKFPQIWRVGVLVAGDFVLFNAALAIGLTLRQGEIVQWPFFLRHLAAFGSLLFLWQVVFFMVGLYDLRPTRALVPLANNIITAATINWFFGVTYFYLLARLLKMAPMTNLLFTVLLGHIFALGLRRVMGALSNKVPLHRRIAFIGDEHIRGIVYELSRHPELGFQPVPANDPKADLLVMDGRWLESHWAEGKPILSAALKKGLEIVRIESFYESLFSKVMLESVGSSFWIFTCAVNHHHDLYAWFKRASDVAISSFLLVALSPFLASVWLAIRFLEGGEPIFRQKRLGYLGAEIDIYKFRTMKPHGGKEAPFSSLRPKDSRVTPLGNVVGSSRVDLQACKLEYSIVSPK